MKFRTTETQNGKFVMARLFAGESYEENHFAGTIVLPAEEWERLLDCLVFGASQMRFAGDELKVHFGPDDGNEE
jgi:hypothetical protein